MTHNSELSAASYLAGELSADERDLFEQHLMSCEECWTEVNEARPGLDAVEGVKEIAPSHLRNRIREELLGRELETQPRARRRLRWPAAAAAVVLATGVSVGVVTLRTSSPEPGAIVAAVSGYSDSRLPGSATPSAPAPDLSPMKLALIGAGAGRLDDLPVDAFAFRDPGGRRLMVFIGEREFPMPSRGRPLNGSDGPWIAHQDGVVVLCARYPHELLIVGKDKALVRSAAAELDAV